jgi:holo-[acyl-carrier protein] synthase
MSHSPTTTPTPGPDDSFGGRAFAPRDDGTVIGVGIDVVEISRLTAMIARTPALLERLLTEGERGLSDASRAARIAAKEAVGKALGAPGDFSWQDVTVERNAARRPHLRLRGAALRAAEAQGVGHLHLSLSHDGDIATAIVVAEREQAASRGGVRRDRAMPDGSLPGGPLPDGDLSDGSLLDGSLPDGADR